MAEEPRIYTVGWICALTSEYIAARNLLDEKYEDEVPSQGDSNTYTLGRMGWHNVVIACLPRGKIGNVSAASVASDMLRSFESIRFGLMVGIGGGAPTSDTDIRLGDVVVSSPDRQVGGVLHYKFGREIQNREFELTGSLASPPAILLSALNQLSAQHVEEGHRIAESIEQMVTRVPNLRQYFLRPPPEMDRLYKADYVHTDDMRADESSQLVVRQPRTGKYQDPAIHYGLIASADQVMKDAHTRDKLAKEQGILCFEMEAAGLMDRFACVVIRGICDYSDTHKNIDWQSYAAATAAAYAKELLAVISGDNVHKMVPMSGDKHHENVLKAVVPALKSSIDGLLKKVDTLGTSADEQKEALANTSKALDEIHRGLSMLNEASSDYKEKLNTLAENKAERESIEQVSDQLKQIQSSQDDFAQSLETLTQHIKVKQEENPSGDWESLSNKAKEQQVDLQEMTNITQGAIEGGSEIAGQLGISGNLTNKLGRFGNLLGATGKVGKFVSQFRGDKGGQRPPPSTRQSTPANVQRPRKPCIAPNLDEGEQRPPLLTRRSAPQNVQVPQRPGITSKIDGAERRPPLPIRRSTFGNVQRPQIPGITPKTDEAEQRPPLPIRRSTLENGRVNDTKTLQEALDRVYSNRSEAPQSPASHGPTIRSFNFPRTSDSGTTYSPVNPTSSSDKGPALQNRPRPTKPPKPPGLMCRGVIH